MSSCPAIESLKALTVALRGMTDLAKANPTAAKDIALAAAGMAVLAKVAGDLAMVVFVGAPLVRGFALLGGSLGAFAPGAAAEGALAALAGGGGAGSLAGLAAAILGLAGAVAGAEKLNEYLGIPDTPAGRAAKRAANPSPHGNYLFDGLSNWWNGFSSAPGSDGHSNAARGGHQGGSGAYHPSSYVTQPGNGGGAVQNIIYMDGRKVAEVVTSLQARSMSAPPAGGTAFDTRMTSLPTGRAVSL